MKRFMIVLALAVGGFLALGAAPALAADSTCATHQESIVAWSIQDDTIDHTGTWKCGGANNEDFSVELLLQKKNNVGTWVGANCGAGLGGQCRGIHPQVGWYTGGTSHTWSFNTFQVNQAGGIDCADWRIHVIVDFRGQSPDALYNSPVASIGGC